MDSLTAASAADAAACGLCFCSAAAATALAEPMVPAGATTASAADAAACGPCFCSVAAAVTALAAGADRNADNIIMASSGLRMPETAYFNIRVLSSVSAAAPVIALSDSDFGKYRSLFT